MAQRPNVLFLMTDEHRADVTGYEGDPVVRTPVLDALARTGVAFRNAYAPSPICVPGRMCMMSGQLPKSCGCLHYGDDLPPFSMTFAKRFSQYAYATVACGKLHHMGTDQLQGWTRRIGMDDMLDVAPAAIDGRVEEAFSVARWRGQKWTEAQEIQRAGIGPSPYVIKDAYAVEGALHFIDEYYNSVAYDRAHGHRPLMLKVSLNQPHYPYITPDAEAFGYYLNRVTPYRETEPFPHPWLGKAPNMPGGVIPGRDVTEREIRRATAAYYAMVETADTMFGQVLDRLRYVGQDLDDWIIVYTSDHGEMLGQHAIWEKQKFFEASVRIPLLIRWPARFGARNVQENVSHCDLFATLCELAGLPVPEGLDSRSLVPLMQGDASGWDDEAISHFGDDFLMIKRGDLKYQSYGPAMPEVLFDLARDPGETRNLIAEPCYAEDVAAFRRRRAELGYAPTA
jgi:choline-sulfatase